MKNNLITSLLLSFLLLFAVVACNDDDEPVNTAPTITINQPTDAEFQAGFTRGQTIQITGTVSDNSMVTTIETQIFYNGINTGLGETIPVNQQSTDLNTTEEVPTNAPAGSYRLVIIATDDEGASTTWEKTFNVS